MDDVLAALKSKNPQVKEGTLKFLHRCLCTTLDAPGKDQVKPLAESLVSLLGDSAEPVRSSAADCLGTVMKILGERAFNPYIESVGELQMAKVKDAFGKAEVRYRAGVKAPAGAKSAAAPAKKVCARGDRQYELTENSPLPSPKPLRLLLRHHSVQLWPQAPRHRQSKLLVHLMLASSQMTWLLQANHRPQDLRNLYVPRLFRGPDH